MSNSVQHTLLIFICCLSSWAQAENTQTATKTVWTLEDFVNDSMERSDSVLEGDLTYQKYQGAYSEKKAVFLPTMNATASAVKSGGPPLTVYNGTSTSLVSSDQSYTNTKVNLSANLFNGLQDAANLKAAGHDREQYRFSLADARYTQVENAIEAFFALLQYESDERNYLKEIETNEKSLKEIENRVRIGSGRVTEVISMQSTIATNRLDLADTQSSLLQQRVKAARLLKIDDTQLKLSYGEARCQPEKVNSLIAKMDPEKRADLKATKEASASLEESLKSNKGKLLPTVDMSSSYTITDNETPSQQGSYNVSLTLTIPFPYSFEKNAQIDQAAKSYALAQAQQEEKRQNLERDRAEIVRQLQADLDQLQRLKEARGYSEKNVEAMKQDHRSGISTYSDVLTAVTSHQEILRKFDRAVLELDLDCYKALIWSTDENQLLQSIKGDKI